MSKAAELAALIGSQTALSNRNLVINGAMQVAQRGDVTGITAADVYGGADRFATNGSSYGTISLVQEADAPEGFAESQRVKFTTARSTTAAGDHFVIGTRLEGQDLQRFKKGTSNAESMTVSFYAKASQATTIQLELFDADNNRHAGKEFAITTSWARYSYSFAGDTTGAFDSDNAVSMYVFFWLGAGTTYTSGTNPDGSWMALDTDRRVHSDVGTTFMDTLNAEFNLTGVQLEVGEQATPFEHRSFADELHRCQRYYVEFRNSRFINGYKRHDAQTAFKVYFPTPMRTTPTATLDDGGSFTNFQSAFTGTQSSPTVFEPGGEFSEIVLTVNSTYSGTHESIPSWESQEVTFDAEL
jgi:hypothetical protein